MKKFRFVSNQNSTINGINDAGIETFTANVKRSLVRENLQNALDAAIPGSDKPVTVEFSLFNIPAADVPDIDTLREVVDKCISDCFGISGTFMQRLIIVIYGDSDNKCREC